MSAEKFMRLAWKEAEKAMEIGEVPVGCVVVRDGEVVSAAHNLREHHRQTDAHAEMLAIKAACERLDSWQLGGCDLYVTMEPCPMCAGAIIQSRIRNVYFGCYDKKAGAFGSVTDLATCNWTHKPGVYGGIMEDACSVLPKQFFAKLRSGEM